MNYILDQTIGSIGVRAQKILATGEPVLIEPANPKFGADFAIPCFKVAATLKKNPLELANILAEQLKGKDIAKAEAVGGFVNIWLSNAVIAEVLGQVAELGQDFGKQQSSLAKQTAVIETNNPNPFKDMHIGHAYNCIIADTLANILELGGAKVHRVSYHGDVGLHVGKSMWGILRFVGRDIKKLSTVPVAERPKFMSQMYIEGSKAYKNDETARERIEELAKQSFSLDDPFFTEVYETCKQWSFDYLDKLVHAIGSKPVERRYLERETDELGRQAVQKHIGDIFTESDGAIIFPGEKYGLHTRVFIGSRGTSLYEARDLGLIQLKHKDFHPKVSVIVTGAEQRDYFSVVLKAASLALPETEGETRNIPTGLVKLSTGKMSSRTGEVVNIEWLFDTLRDAIEERGTNTIDTLPQTLVGALRYAMLRVSIGRDVIFDVNESVSLEGNSGPYLQYAHARGRSILTKLAKIGEKIHTLTPDERALAMKIVEYPVVTQKAIAELAPHHITTYLYELTQEFNRFYEKNRIVGDQRETTRAVLIKHYCQVLENGLGVLGIPAPERL